MTKAEATLSCAATARHSGSMTESASCWLSMPGGPSHSVWQTMSGPPLRRNGAIAASMAAVTASVELGLMTTIGPLMRGA